jgi:hypothetical protein
MLLLQNVREQLKFYKENVKQNKWEEIFFDSKSSLFVFTEHTGWPWQSPLDSSQSPLSDNFEEISSSLPKPYTVDPQSWDAEERVVTA